MKPRRRRIGVWLAAFALALQAFWPLIAQSKPRSVTLVPVCTVGGETHYVEVETGKRGADALHLEHCQLCPLGAAALASRPDAQLFIECSCLSFHERQAEPIAQRALQDARPRAPPFSMLVASHTDKHWRTHEEDSALRRRGARDAGAGRGVVRRGVLLR